MDITTREKKVYTFNLCTESKCSEFMKFAKTLAEQYRFAVIDNPREHFVSNPDFNYLKDWREGKISNMEFLLLVNKYSGRSFNDLSQYPIFPWVLTNYTANMQELKNELKSEQKGLSTGCYRNFTYHMGNLGPKKREKLDQEYDMMVEEGVEPILAEQYGDDPFNIMYGFSNRMIVTQWLARIEPFTTRNYLFSDQKREKRLPVDLFKSFELGMNHKQSNSELIPEHFYLPEMFMNTNLLSLGN